MFCEGMYVMGYYSPSSSLYQISKHSHRTTMLGFTVESTAEGLQPRVHGLAVSNLPSLALPPAPPPFPLFSYPMACARKYCCTMGEEQHLILFHSTLLQSSQLDKHSHRSACYCCCVAHDMLACNGSGLDIGSVALDLDPADDPAVFPAAGRTANQKTTHPLLIPSSEESGVTAAFPPASRACCGATRLLQTADNHLGSKTGRGPAVG